MSEDNNNPKIAPIDLGDDDGFVSITIGGKAVSMCPSYVIDAINRQIPSDELSKGMPFVNIVQKYIMDVYQISEVSAQMAMTFYQAILRAEKEIKDFFSNRLDSRFTSTSTPAASSHTNEARI